jgi:2-oxo-4-hydroxy-4-carboxy--5-ureidoimidazoline (OHCU) decarboxylase
MVTIEEALEGSTPLARKLRQAGPYASTQEVIARMRAFIHSLSDEEKIETLNAHPRIGEDPARLSTRSLQEQGTELMPELKQLNEEYERRFGFRFVVFVNRRPKAEIVKLLRERLQQSREDEMAAGLSAIVDIAEDRFRS